jgi:hypothetical protein
MDAIAEVISAILMRGPCWSPVGKPLRIAIDDSADTAVAGLVVHGVIRGYDLNQHNALTKLLVELDRPIDYKGRDKARSTQWVVTEPCLRKRRTSRLLLASWSIARVVDARSFVDSTYDRTIGIARLRFTSSRRTQKNHIAPKR